MLFAPIFHVLFIPGFVGVTFGTVGLCDIALGVVMHTSTIVTHGPNVARVHCPFYTVAVQFFCWSNVDMFCIGHPSRCFAGASCGQSNVFVQRFWQSRRRFCHWQARNLPPCRRFTVDSICAVSKIIFTTCLSHCSFAASIGFADKANIFIIDSSVIFQIAKSRN